MKEAVIESVKEIRGSFALAIILDHMLIGVKTRMDLDHCPSQKWAGAMSSLLRPVPMMSSAQSL